MPATSRRHAIAADLRTQITEGHLKAGDRLPAETQLATQYAVSTPTLRNALADLQAEGLIEKIHGKGNFIRHPCSRIVYVGGGHPLAELPSPDAPLLVTVRTTQLHAQGDLTTLLKVPPGSSLVEYRCLSQEGSEPRTLARIYVPQDLAPAHASNDSGWTKALADRLSACDHRSTGIEETVTTRRPTPEEAALLHISPALAVLTITRVASDKAGRVIEAVRLILPGDRAEATFTIHSTPNEEGSEG
ncbi:GntR family transcriptional regulator [Streptomyces sp. NPDC089919]|uniref:GntR family transcriptional regulator n=1 Tax=Streptomyces sp. NPDC089919 TaxID=3155188 RepID=UPI003437501E